MGKMQALISVDDGGKNNDTQGCELCDINKMSLPFELSEEGRTVGKMGIKDGYEHKHWYLWTI